MKRWIAGAFVSVCLVTPSALFACSMSVVPVNVRSRFAVELLRDADPIAGGEVTLKPWGENVSTYEFHATSDRAGVAQFVHIPPGKYWATYKRSDIESFAAIKVVRWPRPAYSGALKMHWPPKEPIRVRALSGRFKVTWGNEALRAATLNVLEARSLNSTWKGSTNAEGMFSADVAKGLYLLFVKAAADQPPLEGYLFVRVLPDASQESLDLKLGMSSCGFEYITSDGVIHLF